jgi:predicted phage baseplate assembly protein
MAAHPTRPHLLRTGTTELYLQGVNTRLAPGDPVAVVDAARADAPVGASAVSERWDLRFVAAAEARPAEGHTLVTLDRGLGDEHTPPAEVDVRVFTFRERGGLFGWNAPDARMMSEDVRNNPDLVVNQAQWAGFSFAADRARLQIDPRAVDLDREYAPVVEGGWVCLRSSTQVELYRVTQVNPAARTDFSQSSRITRVFVDNLEHLDDFGRRNTSVLLGSEELPVAEAPNPEPVSGSEVELAAHPEAPLPPARVVLVTGAREDGGQVQVIQTTVAAWDDTGVRPVVTFTDELPELHRTSVRVHANVVAATHGGTVADEVLGSGDAGRAHQRFRLGHQPLTWVPALPGGAAGTLELRVDGLRWEQVATLHAAGPLDRVYTLQRDHDGSTVVGFGDGTHGARLPTGVENVRGTYRKGIGLAGQVAAGQLSLPQTPPPGLEAVTNPAAAGGAADPDAAQDIRRLAPRTVLTLDRLVSVQDYEDYAAAFPGVGKARAVELWDGRRGFVHLTVAGTTGEVLEEAGATVIALLGSIAALQDPAHHTVVAGHDRVTFGAGLKVLVDDAWLADEVLAAVVATLATAFSFPERQFGQPVTAAEVLQRCHTVGGVVAVDLDELFRTDGRVGGIPGVVLPAAVATWDGVEATRAELLLIDPAAVAVSRMDDT